MSDVFGKIFENLNEETESYKVLLELLDSENNLELKTEITKPSTPDKAIYE